MTTSLSFWLPTRPYGLADSVNRVAAATGSPRYAMGAHSADYNGHRVHVGFNSYRGYYTCEYTWSGRNVLARGPLADCLEAAKREQARGALGSTVVVHVRDQAEADLCISMGFEPHSEAIEKAHTVTWYSELHREVGQALRYQNQMGCPAVGFLLESKTLAEYKAKVDGFFQEQRARYDASNI